MPCCFQVKRQALSTFLYRINVTVLTPESVRRRKFTIQFPEHYIFNPAQVIKPNGDLASCSFVAVASQWSCSPEESQLGFRVDSSFINDSNPTVSNVAMEGIGECQEGDCTPDKLTGSTPTATLLSDDVDMGALGKVPRVNLIIISTILSVGLAAFLVFFVWRFCRRKKAASTKSPSTNTHSKESKSAQTLVSSMKSFIHKVSSKVPHSDPPTTTPVIKHTPTTSASSTPLVSTNYPANTYSSRPPATQSMPPSNSPVVYTKPSLGRLAGGKTMMEIIESKTKYSQNSGKTLLEQRRAHEDQVQQDLKKMQIKR